MGADVHCTPCTPGKRGTMAPNKPGRRRFPRGARPRSRSGRALRKILKRQEPIPAGMGPCGSGWSKVSASKKTGVVCRWIKSSWGWLHAALNWEEGTDHVAVCARSRLQRNAAWTCGEACDTRHKRHSPCRSRHGRGHAGRFDADPRHGPWAAARLALGAVRDELRDGEGNCKQVAKTRPMAHSSRRYRPRRTQLSLAASLASIIRSLHIPSHRAAPCVFRQRRTWHWPIIKAP
jgi:hypothetical protein